MHPAPHAGGHPRPTGVRFAEPGRTWVALALLGLATAGCGREDVRVYQAPKDENQPPPRAADPHAGITGRELPATPGTPTLQWQLPAGWQELPASQMRVGHFAITDEAQRKAELTIIPLLGQAGTDLDNVNRWLGQIGGPAISADELARRAETISLGGRDALLFDLAAPDGLPARKRTLAAIQRRDGMAWFYKMTGDDALVTAQKASLVEFLRTLRFPAATEAAAPPPATVPDAPPQAAAPTAPPAPEPAAPGTPTLSVPASWRSHPPGAMQLAKYIPESAAGTAEITIAVLPGDGGGTAGNVNRWRRQLGLPPLADADLPSALKPLRIEGAEAYFVDFTNPDTRQRLLAAGVVRGERSWFYKCMGDAPVVETEQAAFVRFVETARYDH